MTFIDDHSRYLINSLLDEANELHKSVTRGFIEQVAEVIPDIIEKYSGLFTAKDLQGLLYYLTVSNKDIAEYVKENSLSDIDSDIQALANEIISISIRYLSLELRDTKESYNIEFAETLEKAVSYLTTDGGLKADIMIEKEIDLNRDVYLNIQHKCLRDLFEYGFNASPILDHKLSSPARRELAWGLGRKCSKHAFGSKRVVDSLNKILDYGSIIPPKYEKEVIK